MKIEDKILQSPLEKLAAKKAKIEIREKLIKKRERKLKVSRFIEIGTMAARCGIDTLDDDQLIGAFIEIKERSKDHNAVKNWKKNGEEHLKKNCLPLIISFANELDENMKKALKTLNFRWNSFRREWYGYGIKDELEKLIKESHGNIEVAKG